MDILREFFQSYAFGIVAALFLLMVIVMYVSAFIQGRAVSFIPMRIEGKPIKIEKNTGDVTGVMEAIQIRKSIRHFSDNAVEEEKLNKVIEAARLAPSANNKQYWRFIVINQPEIRKKVTACVPSEDAFIENAPIIIVACSEVEGRPAPGTPPYHYIDTAIAVDHMTLEAVEQGLGTCWIGQFKEEKIKKLLRIPDSIKVVVLIPLGYPVDPTPVTKKRLTVEKICRYNQW